MNCFSGTLTRTAAWIASSALAISAFGQAPPPAPDYSNNDPQYTQRADPRGDPNYADPGRDPNYRDRDPNYDAYDRRGPVPPQLHLRPGTFVSVRLDQPLASNRNHEGDIFSATLVRPVVVDGIVVAQAGEMVEGRVVEVRNTRRTEGPSSLGVQLTDLTLVDGTQIPIASQLVSRTAPGSGDHDAGTIIGSTAAGAAIGGAADWGTGAAVGAAAGLAAGTVGVLLTHGRPSVLYPESVLTFRVQSPVLISTVNAPDAFHGVDPREYEQYDRYNTGQQPRRMVAAPASAYYYPPAYYYGGFGPGFGFFYGPGFYGHYSSGRRFRR